MRLCPGRSWPRAALRGDAVADLCEHLLPRWGSLGMGCRMAECVLVSVTLNLSLHISEAPASPGSVSGRLVLGRVCEGGSVSMGRGNRYTPWTSQQHLRQIWGRSAPCSPVTCWKRAFRGPGHPGLSPTAPHQQIQGSGLPHSRLLLSVHLSTDLSQ